MIGVVVWGGGSHWSFVNLNNDFIVSLNLFYKIFWVKRSISLDRTCTDDASVQYKVSEAMMNINYLFVEFPYENCGKGENDFHIEVSIILKGLYLLFYVSTIHLLVLLV